MVQVYAIQLIFKGVDVQTFEIRVTVDVSVSRIDDALSYNFPQTDLKEII